eukprot:498164_1
MSSLRTYQKTLVNGYFTLHFDKYTPQEIVNICIYYCFLLDEFDAKNTSNKLSVIGTNNTIIQAVPDTNDKDTDGKEHENKQALPVLAATAMTKNIINSPAKYHWAFNITNSTSSKFNFLLIDNDTNNDYKCSSICSWWSFPSNNTVTLHMYLDTELKQVINKCNNVTEQIKITKWDEIKDCRLKIRISENINATVEIIEYHNSNLYTQQLLHNPYDPIANIGYAHTICDIQTKIKYYSKALYVCPYVNAWNNEYLSYLIKLKQYNQAYKHAIKFKKGQDSIATLVAYYYDIDKYDNAYNLLMLLHENILLKNDLYFEIAYCSSKSGDSDAALKYYQKYLDYHEDDETNKENTSICIGNMARIQCKNDRYEPALDLFLRLTQAQIDERNVNDDIAYCYRKMKQFDEAKIYYELHIKKNPNSCWAYKQISYLFDEIGDHKSETNCLLKALELARNDEEKGEIYTSLGVNEYLERNMKNAINYGKQALKCFSSTDVADGMVITLSNLGKYYYKINQYEQSFQYLSKAIGINSHYISCVGNYAIILYYLKRFDESVVYLKRCIQRKDEIKDFEMLPDCLYIYGMILNNRNEFDKSNEMCLEAIKCDYFQKYKDKKQIYMLLSDNYSKLLQYEKAQQYLMQANANNT